MAQSNAPEKSCGQEKTPYGAFRGSLTGAMQ